MHHLKKKTKRRIRVFVFVYLTLGYVIFDILGPTYFQKYWVLGCTSSYSVFFLYSCESITLMSMLTVLIGILLENGEHMKQEGRLCQQRYSEQTRGRATSSAR